KFRPPAETPGAFAFAPVSSGAATLRSRVMGQGGLEEVRRSMLSLFATLSAVLFAALVVTAAARDALSFTIPNWISGGLVLLFFPAALAGGLGWPAFGLHLGVGLAALVAGMAMFALRWMGGGDAKLLAAAALWLGWPAVMTFI